MAAIVRLGVQVPPADPFWVQMREGIVQQAQRMGLDLVPIDLDAAEHYSAEQELTASELILAQELDALVSHLFPASLLGRLLQVGLPVIYLNEHPLRHQRFVTTVGLFESAQIGARYMAERLGGRGDVLLVGELQSGRSRLEGACAALREFPAIVQHRVQSPWNDAQARAALPALLGRLSAPLDAILGFSDGLALAARDVGRELGLVDDHTLVVGIDGDPLALAAIAAGAMAATVEISPLDLGRQAVELAHQATRRLPLPPHCRYQPRLVTEQNIAEVAARKLIAMAHLPSRLVGVNRHQERQQLAQLEASQAINRQVTAILDRETLAATIVNRIRAHCGYDQVYLLRWVPESQAVVYEQPAAGRAAGEPALDAAGVLAESVRRNEPIFVPDINRSQRFGPDPAWPATVARVVVPIHTGAQITGVLDLHSATSRLHSRQDLIGLQSLADQLGTALRNAELYEDAVEARAAAERADALKTRLLANVSHELRTPLNVILGYTQSILDAPHQYQPPPSASLLQDVGHIAQNAEHLTRLINDLLDLSRAEIGALDIFPELLDPRTLLTAVFTSMVARSVERGPVRWLLDLPAQLPLIEADPVRVRQIVLNLLSNAETFTASGQIVLGARAEDGNLHLWVADTGSGVPAGLHERIFEPFVTGHAGAGIGLGLSIVRQLVALHAGSMSLESAPAEGSTFHVYLPLPQGQVGGEVAPRPPAMLLVGVPPDDRVLVGLCRRQELLPYVVAADEQVERLFASVRPAAIVCNIDRLAAGEWALIEQIRRHPEGAALPQLLYSPEDGLADEGAWLAGVLMKPLQGAQLIELVVGICPAELAGPVLIVDDDPESCALYRQLVAAALPDAPVRLALGGAAALALLEHEVPGLIILDLMMPGIDGFTVLQRLRASERTRRAPVLVVSGKSISPEDVQRLAYQHVIFQSKGVLTPADLAAQLQRSSSGAGGHGMQTSQLVKLAIAYMQAQHHRPLSRQEIADSLGINRAYLSTIFQQELGLTPWDYLNRYRIARAKSLLRASGCSVTEIAGRVGFNDPSYFGRVFRRVVGCTPQDYRGSAGEAR
jgi:signal transduction histidine kinase/ABC-type sugar transport system substrate-binding protein/AraC-like DNA-binding protein